MSDNGKKKVLSHFRTWSRSRPKMDRLRNTVYDYGYNMTNWLSVTTKGGQTEQE